MTFNSDNIPELRAHIQKLETRLSSVAGNAIVLTSLYETAMELQGDGNVQELLLMILRHAATLFGTMDGYISLVDEKEEFMQVKITMGKFEEFMNFRVERGRGLSGTIWDSKEMKVVKDYDHRMEWSPEVIDTVARIGIPLLSEDKVIGVIALGFTDSEEVVPENKLMILKAFAQMAALGLMKARLLYEKFNEFEEREIIREALDESRRQYKNLAEVAPVGIVRTDLDGNCFYANERWLQIVGVNFGVATSGTWLQKIHPGDRERIALEWRAASKENIAFETEFRYLTESENITWVFAQMAPEKDLAGKVVGYIGTFTNINERKQAEEVIKFQAFHDPLTGLPNRELLKDRLQNEIYKASRNKRKLGILFMDLDHFKEINDSFGHSMGDWLLKEVSQRLLSILRKSDTVARQGGDEFIVLLPDISEVLDLDEAARKILKTIQKKFTTNNKEFYVGASIGISIYPDDGTSPDILLRNADAALYSVKARSRNAYEYYTEALNLQSLERIRIESELHKGLENDEFILHYQPKIDIVSRQVTGVEALIRWQKKDGSLVSPLDFIQIAEDTGLIIPIGEKILGLACTQILKLHNMGLPLSLAVNFSPRQFMTPDVGQHILDCVHDTGFPTDSLEVEITESMLIKDYEGTLRVLEKLKEEKIKIAIDDFGTGYSSLSYLKSLPIDILKIDRSFMKGVPEEKKNSAILQAILDLSHNLDFSVIAEGVETVEQLAFLQEKNCRLIQGFLFCRPLPFDKLTELLLNKQSSLFEKIA